MSKMSFEQKRQRILDLEANIKRDTEELRELIDPAEKVAPLPSGFSLNEKVLEVMKETPERIEKSSIIPRLKEKYGVTVSSEQLTSALSALKYKDLFEIIGRAVYKLKQ